MSGPETDDRRLFMYHLLHCWVSVENPDHPMDRKKLKIANRKINQINGEPNETLSCHLSFE